MALTRFPRHEPGLITLMEGEPVCQFPAVHLRPTPARYLVALVKTFKGKIHLVSCGNHPPVQRQIHRAEMEFATTTTSERNWGWGNPGSPGPIAPFQRSASDPQTGISWGQQRLANQTTYSRTGQ
jgi:hypothetical protein